jgi:hypothetical protein
VVARERRCAPDPVHARRGAAQAADEGRLRLRALASFYTEDVDAASGLRYRSHLTLSDIDCAQRTMTPVRGAWTREAMGEGSVLRRSGRGATQPIAARTVAAVLYRAACGKPLPA